MKNPIPIVRRVLISRVMGFAVIGCTIGVVVAIVTLTSVEKMRNYGVSEEVTLDRLRNIMSSSEEDFDLDVIASSDTGYLAKTTFYRYLAQASPDELLKVLGQTQQIADFDHRQEIQIATLRALVHVDEERAVEQCLKLEKGDRERPTIAVFEELARANLDAAIVRVRVIEPPLRNLVIASILLIPVEPPRLKEEQEELVVSMGGNLNEVTRLLVEQRIEKNLKDPRLAWQLFDENQLTLPQQDRLLFQVAEQALIQDGMQGIFSLLKSQPKWNSTEVKRIFGDAISSFALRDVKQAFKDTLTMEGAIGSFVRDEVLSTWAMLDPMEALEAISFYEPSNERFRLERLVIQVWGQVTPLESLEHINEVPRHLRDDLRTVSLRLLADSEPERAKEFVESIVNPKYKTQHAQELVHFLTPADPEGTVSWVLNNPALEDVRHQVLVEVISSLVFVDPNLALETALAAPDQPELSNENWYPNRYDWNLQAVAIDFISHLDVDLALNMVPRVDADSKLSSYQNIGSTLVRLRDYERALELADQLEESDRNDYYNVVLSHWSGWWGTQLDLVNHIDRIPLSHRSKVARLLLWRNKYDDFLSDSQLVNIKNFLNEEDATVLDEPEHWKW